MNIQAITVIFVIIFLPIILVSNFYIQREMDTINIQNYYDTKLIDATTDAISAFELNTANEDLSLIPDSLRSIVEASTNVFTTTLATNLGISSASKNKILPYIPAIVFTLYDGYYIYSPTQQPKVAVNKDGVYVKVGDAGVVYLGGDNYEYNPNVDPKDIGTNLGPEEDYGKMLYCTTDQYDPYQGYRINCTTNPNAAYFITSYILKSFIPYSMQYSKSDNYDVTINYTLDNYISVKGIIKTDGNDVYYTKSGYLINPDDITEINIGDYNPIVFSTTTVRTDVSLDTIDSIVDEVLNNTADQCKIKFRNGIEIDARADSEKSKTSKGDSVKDNVSALKYYVKAYMFSCWFRDNLGDISENDIQSSAKELQNNFNIKQSGLNLQNDAKIFWDYGTEKIFFTNGGWNINDTDSNFIEHKRKVIKNSIQYNLNLAMAVYNAGQGDEYYQMPLLSDKEWDKIMTNVSMVAFMQGFPCGLKTYNNYALITSTKNEIMTNIDDIYYIPIDKGDTTTYQGVLTDEEIQNSKNIDLDTAHKIDCVKEEWLIEVKAAELFQSFSAKDLKYDKVYNYSTGKYEYDHVANECYYCIVNPNYNSLIKDALNNFTQKNDGSCDISGVELDVVKKLKWAQLIADGKIKNNTFKSISATTNYGIYTMNFSNGTNNIASTFPNAQKISKDSKITEWSNTSVNGKTLFSDDLLNHCYEIDVTVTVDNMKTSVYNPQSLSMAIGDDKQDINMNITQTYKFTDVNNWKNNVLTVYNPDGNYRETDYIYDASGHRTGFQNYICSLYQGNITLNSITFKYK